MLIDFFIFMDIVLVVWLWNIWRCKMMENMIYLVIFIRMCCFCFGILFDLCWLICNSEEVMCVKLGNEFVIV